MEIAFHCNAELSNQIKNYMIENGYKNLKPSESNVSNFRFNTFYHTLTGNGTKYTIGEYGIEKIFDIESFEQAKETLNSLQKDTTMSDLKYPGKEQILKAASDCPQAEKVLKTLFPDIFPKTIRLSDLKAGQKFYYCNDDILTKLNTGITTVSKYKYAYIDEKYTLYGQDGNPIVVLV